MSENTSLSSSRHRWYRILGLCVSVAYVAALVLLSLRSGNSFAEMAPNEWGDFLAGCFGPLALFWLILGFWQQGDELRASVEALMLQSDELRNSVEQQRALVDVTRQQAEAELAALQEERQARRLATSPHITLHPTGGHSSATECVRRIRLTNLGANCSDLKLAMSGGYQHSRFISTLQTGGFENIELTFPGREPPEFDMEMTYSTVSGERHTRRFGLTPGGSRGLKITEMIEMDEAG